MNVSLDTHLVYFPSEKYLRQISLSEILSSDDGGGATPVPIPNTEVKSSSVDGT